MEQKARAHNSHNRSTMEATSRSLWQCSACTYAENKWAAVECEVCGAIVRAKRPASPIPDAVASTKPCKKKKPPPQDPPPPTHPSGVVVDVVGMNKSDCGCSCEEHPDGCGAAVLADDVVVRIRKEQILVKAGFLGKGRMREETVLTVNWVSDGIDRCRIGFLPKAYVPNAKMWDGALCQVVFVGAADNPSLIICRKFHQCCGYARVAVISALGRDVKVFHDKYEAMMD
jgi:hypothetical protein